MKWDLYKEPGRFIICKAGQKIVNRFYDNDWVEVFPDDVAAGGYFLYDTVTKVIFSAPLNAMYTIENIPKPTSKPKS